MSYVIKQETLDGIADAIRLKTGIDKDIQAEDFEDAILSIRTCENTDVALEAASAAAKSAKDADTSAYSAQSSAIVASEAAGRAALSEAIAVEKAEIASISAESAKESETNAKASEEIAVESAEAAKIAAEAAAHHGGFNSEAYAVGTRNGIPVVEGDVAYHNNAKYYAEQAALIDALLPTANVFANAAIVE